MLILIAGLVLFFSVHSVSIVNDPWRNRVAARLGERAWMGLYALLSIAGFVLIVWGYGLARQEPVVIYTPPAWLRHPAMLLLLFVFPLLIATYFPGRISRATRHPMLAATKIWAFSHLLVNGTLAFTISYGVVYWAEQWVPSGLTAVLFVVTLLVTDILYRVVDPRVSLK